MSGAVSAAIIAGLALVVLDAAVHSPNRATEAGGFLDKAASWLIDPSVPGIPDVAKVGGAARRSATTTTSTSTSTSTTPATQVYPLTT